MNIFLTEEKRMYPQKNHEKPNPSWRRHLHDHEFEDEGRTTLTLLKVKEEKLFPLLEPPRSIF